MIVDELARGKNGNLQKRNEFEKHFVYKLSKKLHEKFVKNVFKKHHNKTLRRVVTENQTKTFANNYGA